jgi:hypothetical protein
MRLRDIKTQDLLLMAERFDCKLSMALLSKLGNAGVSSPKCLLHGTQISSF